MYTSPNAASETIQKQRLQEIRYDFKYTLSSKYKQMTKHKEGVHMSFTSEQNSDKTRRKPRSTNLILDIQHCDKTHAHASLV